MFDRLITSVDRQLRDTNVIEASGLLPNTRFYTQLLTDNTDERKTYFDGFLKSSQGRGLVCFDPDNGLEVKSVKYGRKQSSKFLYMHEVSESFNKGHSLLIYQTMLYKPDQFARELADNLQQETKSPGPVCVQSSGCSLLPCLTSQASGAIRGGRLRDKRALEHSAVRRTVPQRRHLNLRRD